MGIGADSREVIHMTSQAPPPVSSREREEFQR
jgi:hypothetical protein